MTNVRRLGCQIPSHVAAFSHLQLLHGHIKMCGHFSFDLKFHLAHLLPLRFLTSLWVWVACAEALLAFSSNFQPLQISAEAGQGLELEHWQVQPNPEEVSRIMQVKDASNVTLHVLDILLMPIDETVRTYSHLLLTHWSRPTARLPPAESIASWIYIILIYIAFIYPLALHCRPGSFRTWLCFSSVTSRDCQFWQVALVFRLESVNQSNLAKLAITAPFRGILTDWLANWLIFRHLNFKSVPKHGIFAHFDLQTWSYCRWETL